MRSLNLGIKRGECFGLLGPNGAGKSTSMSMMVRATAVVLGSSDIYVCLCSSTAQLDVASLQHAVHLGSSSGCAARRLSLLCCAVMNLGAHFEGCCILLLSFPLHPCTVLLPCAGALMQVGLIEPSGGDALIGGFDITKNMDDIYSLMGVCPQHDLLWETLTGSRSA